jgi:hypothetical protein
MDYFLIYVVGVLTPFAVSSIAGAFFDWLEKAAPDIYNPRGRDE